jgi:GNAT superfamily N-acetyltransferase
MILEKANTADAEDLSVLCFASKAYWGYSQAQLNSWRDELTISAEYILKNQVYKLKIDERLIAFYSYYAQPAKTVFMDNLFVDPTFIGKGFGQILMDDFLIRIMDEGKIRVILHADPNAENFYLKRGFKTIGKKETNIEGRFLPIMELKL